MLQIDEDAGTYEIVKTTESGSADDGTYEFDTETVKKGKLDDLKKSNEAYEQKQLAMRRLINCV